MSGHSKWSTIKRQKGANDAKRGAAFTKAGNAITIAAREGGGNTESNFKLRLAVEQARSLNMPKDNIERAISRGTGAGKDGSTLEEVIYEGYGPAGVAIMVEAVTDNRQRTAQEVRSVFDRAGGNLGGPGAVSHFFQSVGEVSINSAGQDPDNIFLQAAEAGADDVETQGDISIVYCSPSNLEKVKNQLAEQGLNVVEAILSKKPISNVKISEEGQASSVLSLVSRLEDLSDVQKVYANFDVPDEILNKVAASV